MIQKRILFTTIENTIGTDFKKFGIPIHDQNFKRTVLRMMDQHNSPLDCIRAGNTLKVWAGNGVLMDAINGTILAIAYNSSTIPDSTFFKKGPLVIRLYFPFVNKEVENYKSLYSALKTYVLKPLRDCGALYELVSTQTEMKAGLIAVLNRPNFSTIADYKDFTNQYLNTVKNELSNDERDLPF